MVGGRFGVTLVAKCEPRDALFTGRNFDGKRCKTHLAALGGTWRESWCPALRKQCWTSPGLDPRARAQVQGPYIQGQLVTPLIHKGTVADIDPYGYLCSRRFRYLYGAIWVPMLGPYGSLYGAIWIPMPLPLEVPMRSYMGSPALTPIGTCMELFDTYLCMSLWTPIPVHLLHIHVH